MLQYAGTMPEPVRRSGAVPARRPAGRLPPSRGAGPRLLGRGRHLRGLGARPGPGGDNEFVFYDGPPFANGLPHYGHLLTGFVKDAVPRYQTMRGHRVERRFGWDCHGLPAEMEAEKELEVSGRAGIVEYGIDRFNDYCRALVQRTTDAWERYVTRQARWVDFANDYKTMDLSYMESVMWAFKALWEKGLLYEGERVLPYCWECETPLSNFETRQDDAYRPRRTPPSRCVFTLDADASGPGPAGGVRGRCGCWRGRPRRGRCRRTWPWPSGPTSSTPSTSCSGAPTAIAAERAGAYPELFEEAEPLARCTGPSSSGGRYRPLFPFFADQPGAFRVLAGDFVATDEGTGVVHLAPGLRRGGLDVCRQAAGIAVVCPVDDRARFTAEVPPYAGLQVFDANAAITADLRASGALVEAKAYTHSYPHCWRTDTPLIYKAVSSWFVDVTAIKDRMLELNQEIDWVPAHIKDGAFGKWLEGARDWSISRNRFWGAPIPVWKSDDPRYPRIDVYGSLDELERDFGVRLDDLHRPAIDELVRPNPDDPTGRSTMRRVTDVLDCWFESGLDALRPGPLPLRAGRVVRVALPGRLHRRVRGPDAGLVLHAARARHRAVRPAARSATAWPTASCSATTAARCPSASATTPSPTWSSTCGAPTPCAGSCCRRRSCAARTSSSTPRGSRRCAARS